jgi:glycosyltransferase involved in cell wall biosynthesis
MPAAREAERTTIDSEGVGLGSLRRKKVLFLGHSAFQGGAELCLDTLLKNLDLAKYDVTVFFPWDGPMVESARAAGARVEIRPLNWWMCWGFSLWYFKNLFLTTLPNIVGLVRYVRRQRIDLVYTNSGVLFEGALAAFFAGVPHVWHIHEVLSRGNVSHAVLPLCCMKKMFRWFSKRIIFESNASRNVFVGPGEDAKSAVVYNCVRIPDRPPALTSDEARRRFGLRDEDQVVSFVGRFSERKNPLLLVRAAARIADRSRLRFLFAGEGPLRDQLLSTIDSLDLRDCCQVLPFQDDVTAILSATDVLVLPSRQESFGLVLIEAAALGKPVIATRTEGPSEIIVDGVTGFLVANDDEEEMARKLIELFGPHVDRRKMGQAATSRARELFSAPEHARKVEVILDELLVERDGFAKRGGPLARG